MGLLQKIFDDLNAKEVKKIEKIVDKIEGFDEEMQGLSDEELQAKTPYFKERLASGETLDDILPEAFAVCREADYRVLGMKPFRVQLIGGVVLHQGRIAEMKTGEGNRLFRSVEGACCYKHRFRKSKEMDWKRCTAHRYSKKPA